MGDSKKKLIVTGVARSGTTALAKLLNSHPAIGLGIERFKFQYLIRENFSASLFERDRYLNFLQEDTNLLPDERPHWKPYYDRIAKEWDNLEVIGDKVPDMMRVLPAFIAENPDFRYICILRNLKDVGLSWQARANRTRDKWPAGKGFKQACESWAEQQIMLSDLVSNNDLSDKLLLLDYDRMYDTPEMTAKALLAFLDLPPAQSFINTLIEHAEFTSAREVRKVPKKFVEAYKAVDMKPTKYLRHLAQEQLEKWANTRTSDDKSKMV